MGRSKWRYILTMADFNQELQSQLQNLKPAAHQDASLKSRVALQGLRPSRMDNDTVSTGIPTVDDKSMAIQDVYDMQEKTQINFIILGDLARTIRDRQSYFDGDKIEVGFHVNNLVPEIKSLFATWGFEETKYGYKYYFTPPIKWDIKIPVEIHIFHKKYPFFENPDIGWFGVDDYRLPNPFEAYWKMRGLIR